MLAAYSAAVAKDILMSGSDEAQKEVLSPIHVLSVLDSLVNTQE